MNKLFKVFAASMAVMLFICLSTDAQENPKSALKALGAPNNPRVQVAWNRY